MWYEICVASQEHNELDADSKITHAFNYEGKTGIPISKSMPSTKEEKSNNLTSLDFSIVPHSSNLFSHENIKKFTIKEKINKQDLNIPKNTTFKQDDFYYKIFFGL